MKILVLDGVYPINTRSRRIIKSLTNNYEVKYCSWDRGNKASNELKGKKYIFSSNEGYGNKLKKLKGMFSFYCYYKRKLKEYNPNTIIASQWDMLLLAILAKKRNQKVIYDNIDVPTSSNFLILYFLKLIEKICMKRVEGTIYASRFFKEEYSKYQGKELVFENYPLKDSLKTETFNYTSEKLKISFIGTVRYFEIMKNLVDEVKKFEDSIEVLIFGSGPDEERLKKIVEKNSQKNVKFFGPYKYENIEEYYKISDVIWAVYPNKDPNVKLAISNKFFESIIYEKPCYFASQTKLGEFIEKNSLGFVVNPYNLNGIFNEIEKQKIQMKEKNLVEYKREKLLYWEENEEKLKKFIKEI